MSSSSSSKLKAASLQVEDASQGDTRLVRAQAQLHLGPLDSPDTMLAYQAIDPNFPRRLLTMVEIQGQHRRDIELRVVEADIKRAATGQWLGFTVTIIGFGVASLLGQQGHPTAAAVVGSINLVALVGIFVNGRKETEKKK